MRRIKAYGRKAKILIFTMCQCVKYALKTFEAGTADNVTKSSLYSELIGCMKAVLAAGRR